MTIPDISQAYYNHILKVTTNILIIYIVHYDTHGIDKIFK